MGSLNCSDQRAVGPHEPLIGMPGILPCSSQTQNIAFKFDRKHREFRHRSRDFEADSLQICSKTNLFGLLHATPPLEDPPPNLRQHHPGATDPEATLSLTTSELPHFACAASPKGRAQAVVRPPIQRPHSREVVKGGALRDSLRRGPELIGCV